MADRKITDLTALAAGSQATGDLVTIVDVSESAAADKNKKMTMENLFKGIPGSVGIGTSSPSATLDVTNGGFCLKDTSSSFTATESISYFHDTSTQYAEIEFTPQNASTGRIFVKNRVSSALSDVVTIEGSNVGIGTTSISNDIHLKRTGADAILRIENTGNGNHSGIFFVRESSGGTSKGAANIHVESDTSGTGTALAFGCGSNTSATGGERMRIDSSGRLLLGTTTGRLVNNHNMSFQQFGTDSASSRMAIFKSSNDDGGSGLHLCKSRGTAGDVVVSNGDQVGILAFNAYDGTDFRHQCASIESYIDTTPGGDDLPGRLVFSTTANGGTSPSERMRITNGGKVLVGISDQLENTAAARLQIGHTSGALLAIGRNDGAVTEGNDMGKIAFYGNDGGTYEKVAQILCEADGAHAAGDKPGRLIFQTTADSDSSPTERLRIDSSGNVGIGTSSPSSLLQVNKNSTSAASGGLRIATADSDESFLELGVSTSLDKVFISSLANGSGSVRPLTFVCGASSSDEAMRIDSSGHLLIGTTSKINITTDSTDGSVIESEGTIVASRAGNPVALFRRRSSDGDVQNFYRDTSKVGSISVTTSATAYNTSSDYRLKENVVDLDGAITRVKQLAPKRFNFIADDTATVDGFLAHEAQAVVPEAVTGTYNEVDDDNNPVYQGIDQSKLVPLLTAALQEAIAKIETLEAKVAALEAQ